MKTTKAVQHRAPLKRIHSWVAMTLGLGIILLLIAFSAGVFSIGAFLERQQHGSGPMFADVELLGMLAIICGITGGFLLFAAKKISGYWKNKGEQGPLQKRSKEIK